MKNVNVTELNIKTSTTQSHTQHNPTQTNTKHKSIQANTNTSSTENHQQYQQNITNSIPTTIKPKHKHKYKHKHKQPINNNHNNNNDKQTITITTIRAIITQTTSMTLRITIKNTIFLENLEICGDFSKILGNHRVVIASFSKY